MVSSDSDNNNDIYTDNNHVAEYKNIDMEQFRATMNSVQRLKQNKPPPIELVSTDHLRVHKMKKRELPSRPKLIKIISVQSQKINVITKSFNINLLVKEIGIKLGFEDKLHYLVNDQLIDENTTIKDVNLSDETPLVMFHVKHKKIYKLSDIDPFQISVIRYQSITGFV